MGKILKIIGFVILGLGMIIGGGIAYLFIAFPKVPSADKDLRIEATPERIERGKYLADNVAGCLSCHSPRSIDKYGYFPTAGKEYTGFPFSKFLVGLPGKISTVNLTLLQNQSDGELYRAIAMGVNSKGKAMFPMMHYLALGTVDREDIYSIITYLRTLKPQGEPTPPAQFDFPFSLIVRTIPKPAAHRPKPDSTALPAERGEYLVRMAACMDCHTPVNEKMLPLPGMTAAGGQPFILQNEGTRVIIKAANITPDMTTGIGAWTEATFINVIRERGEKMKSLQPVPFGETNSIMGYWEYSGMTDQDLGAIYAYLRTLPPVSNQVERFAKAPNP